MSESTDIGKQQVATIYAKALVGAAEKSGSTAAILTELDSLVDDVLATFPKFEETVGSPRLSVEEKSELVDRVFGGKASEDMQTFLNVLCQHERLDCLRAIRVEAHRLQNELLGRSTVEVTTAQPLSEQQREQIVHELQVKMSCELNLVQKIDEDIIGGIVVRVGDTVVDGSVRNQLQQMRAKAVERVVEQIHDNSEKFSPS